MNVAHPARATAQPKILTSSPHPLQRLATFLSDSVRQMLDRWQPPETGVLIGTAVLVGISTGIVAVFFIWLIDVFAVLFFDTLQPRLGGLGPLAIVVIPALGGLIGGPMITFVAREAKGHGVPEVMQAIALQGGRMRPIVAAVKAVASSICIGSGGSAGREGPIVQIGAVLGLHTRTGIQAVRRAYPQPGGLRHRRRHRRRVQRSHCRQHLRAGGDPRGVHDRLLWQRGGLCRSRQCREPPRFWGKAQRLPSLPSRWSVPGK